MTFTLLTFVVQSTINTNYNHKSTTMAYRLIDPQILLNKLLKIKTSTTTVEVLNNISEIKNLGEKTPEDEMKTPTFYDGYGYRYNNSNSPFTHRSIDSVKSPEVYSEPPTVLKDAFTRTIQPRTFHSVIPPVQKLVPIPPRPKAADPRNRRRPTITKASNAEEENKTKGGRPKGAHHKNHPMLVPGSLIEGSDDDVESSPTPILTFVPGKKISKDFLVIATHQIGTSIKLQLSIS